MKTPPAPAALEILIIEDNKVDREALRRYLTTPSRGIAYNFHETDTGRKALELLAGRRYDGVFLDYRLPDMDGISLLKRIYDPATDTAGSPLVMLTGQGSESVMLDALRCGAQDYVMKDSIAPDTLHIALAKARELFDTKAARRQAEEQLHHVRKMEAVGQLTSGIAHDFNNLLTVVSGNIYLLRRRIAAGLQNYAPEDVEAKLQAMETAAARGADLVRRLMVFSRQSPLSQEVVDVNECLSETLGLLKRTLGDNIEVSAVLKEDVWPISVDVSELQNMVINFAVNARDAMPKGGRLTIETDNVMLDEAYTLRHPDVKPGPYMMIAISDTGTGMSPEVRQRIFEPFFTTKPVGEGTGLGMSMAYGFLRQSNGHIHVYSEEGHGTVFRVYLPKFCAGDDEAEEEETATAPAGRETVLVVEDEDDARALAVGMLERLGYRTLEARNGKVAIELLKGERGRVDLVFTDLHMPGGESGIEMVRRMRAIEPGLRVLYTSGYSENALPGGQIPDGGEILSKPYRREALALKVRKILDETGGKNGKKAHSGH